MDFLSIKLFYGIDITDLIDLALVSLFIYAGLVWFKKTRAFLVVIGIVFLGIIFAIAKYMNLYLTTAILQGFFAIILLAIIIIFQEEFRHFFERVALWGLGRQNVTASMPMVNTLVRTVVDLAHNHTGALIVLVGRDHIARHIEGGIALGGRVSEPLLKSLFDTHSPGHDGAVIIENERVSRFAAHLPLSKEITKLAGMGTRHAAGLGISERCDALCIIVSEERGIVSIARNGEIIQYKDTEKLAPFIDHFFQELFPLKRKKRWQNIFKKNLTEKITAVLLAVSIWLIFAYKTGDVQRSFMAPVEYTNLPKELDIERATPREILVTLSGEERAFKLFHAQDLKVTLDLQKTSDGKYKLPVSSGVVANVPHNLQVDNFKPEWIDIVLKKDQDKAKK